MGLILNAEDLCVFRQAVERHSGPMVCDVETNGLDIYRGHRIIGWAFYLPTPSGRHRYYIPVRHRPMQIACVGSVWEGYETAKLKRLKHKEVLIATGDYRDIDLNLDPGYVAEQLQSWLFCRDRPRPIVNWNIKFDRHAIEAEGITIYNQTLDVMVAAHMADENQPNYQLDYHGKLRLGEEKLDGPLEEWARARKITNVKAHLAIAPLWLVAEYAMQDCVLTWNLAEFYKVALQRERISSDIRKGTLFNLWLEVGGSYNDAIQRMEKHGLRVNRELVAESINMAEVKVDGLYQSMAKEVGRDFNPRSNPELRKILRLPKTNKAYLSMSDHPLVPLLEEYRQWTRMLTTYYRPWLQLADENGYLHPSLLIHGTVAGRLSCRLPNMQNLPRLSDIYDVRRAIIAPEGMVLVEADLSQAELRLATHYCMDPTWVEAYLSGGDIHQSTSDLLGLTEVYGKKEGRQAAKTLNFAMLYGMGAEALSSTLTMAGLPTTIEQAKQILFEFKGNKPTLVKLCKDLQTFARANRYIELWTGRRRHYPHARIYGLKDDTHSAPNNLIQGGVAELMRCIITELDHLFEANRRQMDTPRMHLQVHDSILFSMKPRSVDRWLPIIRTVMEEQYQFRIPMKADFKIGESWAAMKGLEVAA